MKVGDKVRLAPGYFGADEFEQSFHSVGEVVSVTTGYDSLDGQTKPMYAVRLPGFDDSETALLYEYELVLVHE